MGECRCSREYLLNGWQIERGGWKGLFFLWLPSNTPTKPYVSIC